MAIKGALGWQWIASLERAGVSPKLAQTLARHSDIRLTMQVYTHVELADQTAAIATLPGPGVAISVCKSAPINNVTARCG